MPLDPSVAERVHLLHEMAALGFWASPEGRARWDEFFAHPDGYTVPDVDVRDERLARPDAPDLPVRVYRDPGTTGGPGLVWMHGGGFVGGSLDMFEGDGVARELARRTGGTVVSVDYRLAVDGTVFPAPFDDVRDAWEWTLAHVDELGIDGTVALGGASAGAALAAGTAVALRDDGGRAPDLLVLVYPTVHPVLPPYTHELAAKVADIPEVFAYGPTDGDDLSNPSLAALLGEAEWRATSHAMAGLAPAHGMPRTLIVNAEYDTLRASGEAYAAQLAAAGVDVEVRRVVGMLHGCFNLPPVAPVLDAALDVIAGRLVRP